VARLPPKRIFLFGLFAATPQSAAFLVLVGGYFGATGPFAQAAVLGAGAVILFARWFRARRRSGWGSLRQ
jgi:hypothetical protein